MKIKNKTHKIFFLILCLGLLFVVEKNIAQAAFNYQLLESFPGFFNAKQSMTDLPAMILAIYKFGIWTVGIAGLFMLVVGGFTYMASAGNNSTASSAKEIITDALLGIVAALGAYLILYVINPDLTVMKIGFTSVNVTVTEGTPMGTGTPGVCAPATTAACSVSTLTPTFAGKATEASSICNGESDGRTDVVSGPDRCQGNGTNDPVSIGLFQINLTVHPIGNLPCPDAFNKTYEGARDKPICFVKNRPLYDQCVTAAKNAANNIAAAKKVFTQAGSSWKPWGANTRFGCNFR